MQKYAPMRSHVNTKREQIKSAWSEKFMFKCKCFCYLIIHICSLEKAIKTSVGTIETAGSFFSYHLLVKSSAYELWAFLSELSILSINSQCTANSTCFLLLVTMYVVYKYIIPSIIVFCFMSFLFFSMKVYEWLRH